MNMRSRFFAVLLAGLLFLPLGFVFGQQLQVGEDIKKTRAALASNPSNSDARSRLVGLYYKQGVEDLRNRFYAEAVRAFQAGLAAGLQEAETLQANAPEVEEARYALVRRTIGFLQVRADQLGELSAGEIDQKIPGQGVQRLGGVSPLPDFPKIVDNLSSVDPENPRDEVIQLLGKQLTRGRRNVYSGVQGEVPTLGRDPAR